MLRLLSPFRTQRHFQLLIPPLPHLSATPLPPPPSPLILQVGFELAGDLAKAAASYPAVSAFTAPVAGALDLRPLWLAWGMQSQQQVGTGGRGVPG